MRRRGAARDIMQVVSTLRRGELLLALISGGGSSLLSLPVPQVSMPSLEVGDSHDASQWSADRRDERRAQTPVADRRRAARRAAVQRGAHVIALMISTSPATRPTDIASGPSAPDPTTYADALEVLSRWKIEAPEDVVTWLQRGAAGDADETPKPGDPLFRQVENRVIATAHRSLEAAAEVFRSKGIHPVVLGDTVTGEAREVAKVYASLVREIRSYRQPFKPPVALISGGECTVTLPPGTTGRGGRCTEFLLSLALELESTPDVYALACDTDGIDGTEGNAGAWLEPRSMAQAAAQGFLRAKHSIDAIRMGFSEQPTALDSTGPTRTNVNDYRVILIQ